MGDTDKVTLFAVGDIGCDLQPADRLAELIGPVMKQADLGFGQCERVYSKLGREPRTAWEKKRTRGRLPASMASVWNKASINIVSMASNHTMEWGGDAFLDTIELFRGMGKHVIGGGRNIEEARKPTIVEYKGVKIAFLGYCSVLPEDHEAGENKAGITPMRAHTYYDSHKRTPLEDYTPGTPPRVITVPYEDDLRALVQDIKRAKEQADAVVMSIHWGLHHIPKALCDYQPIVAHAAIDAGADLILGHHPHVIRAIEVYKGKVCFYSIGQFMKSRGAEIPPFQKRNQWNLWWYEIDPECLGPTGMFPYPNTDRKTMIAKAVFSKKGVEKVSFLPAFINSQAQPEVLLPDNPRFKEVVAFTDWSSDCFPHKFRVEGPEVVVET